MTTNELVPMTAATGDAVSVQDTYAQANEYIRQSKAQSTLRAYKTGWLDFERWCEVRRLASLPATPGTVALYIADKASADKVATIARRLAAISKAHQAAGYASPASLRHAAVSEVWKGIRRVLGTAQAQKTPVLIDDVRRMVAVLDTVANKLLAVRDRALLLVGFAGAFRRSELVALDVQDVQFTADGLLVTIRRSKTDQEGEGRKVGIPYGSTLETCPVRSLQRWLEVSAVSAGALFCPINRHGQLQDCRLSAEAVAGVVKRYAKSAGLNPADYAGHSLRSGLVTTAAIAGVSERAIMNQTGHKSTAMVRRYIRDANVFRDNAAAKIGL